MKKKQIALLLATAMAVTSLAGCGQQEVSGTETKTSAESTETTESVVEEVKNFNEEGYPIVNEEITLKVLINARDADNWMDVDEMPAIKRMEEETGINLEWEVVKSSDWATKTNLMFATEEYPDLILAQEKDIDFEEYGVVQKVLIPLDDLIDQYLPSYTERIALEDIDPTINLIASDGQTYSVGHLMGTGHATTTSYMINQQWLDALKLPMPTNTEELMDTLRAFKTKDPNGNGQADEIPFSVRMVAKSITNSTSSFLQWFGIPFDGSQWIYIDNNKEVQFAPYQDGFRECMEWLHQCYDEGLLDVEVFSQDGNTWVAKCKNGVVGFASFYNLGSNLGQDAWANWSAYVPESDTTVMEQKANFANACAYITVANEYPEATMRLLEYMIDPITQYTLHAGEAEYKDHGWKINDAGVIETWEAEGYEKAAISDHISSCGLFFAPPATYEKYYNVAINTKNKWAVTEKYQEAGLLQTYPNEYLKLVTVTPEQNEMINLVKTEIDTAVTEAMATFIKDGVTDASWEAFQKVFEGMKVGEYVQIYQDGIDNLDILK